MKTTGVAARKEDYECNEACECEAQGHCVVSVTAPVVKGACKR